MIATIFKGRHWAYFLILIGLTSCFSKPSFPHAPNITFKSIEQASVPDGVGGTLVDSLVVTIEYEDGNGDLGLDVSDTLAPFQLFKQDGTTINPNYFNFYISLERKVSGQYIPFVFPNNATLNGRFPRLIKDDKKNPIAGTISMDIVPLLSEFPENDTVRFSIQIQDRSLNKSNTIKTDPVTINRAF